MRRRAVLRFHRISLILTLLFATIGCDQATKVVARDVLKDSGPLSYVGGSIRILHTQNSGAFLSLGSELSDALRFWIFTVFVSLVLLAGTWILFRKRQMGRWATVGLTLVVAGGIGNLIDRITFGTVTDFIHIAFGVFQTGIFNIADVAIVGGVIILTLKTLKTTEGPLRSH